MVWMHITMQQIDTNKKYVCWQITTKIMWKMIVCKSFYKNRNTRMRQYFASFISWNMLWTELTLKCLQNRWKRGLTPQDIYDLYFFFSKLVHLYIGQILCQVCTRLASSFVYCSCFCLVQNHWYNPDFYNKKKLLEKSSSATTWQLTCSIFDDNKYLHCSFNMNIQAISRDITRIEIFKHFKSIFFKCNAINISYVLQRNGVLYAQKEEFLFFIRISKYYFDKIIPIWNWQFPSLMPRENCLCLLKNKKNKNKLILKLYYIISLFYSNWETVFFSWNLQNFKPLFIVHFPFWFLI